MKSKNPSFLRVGMAVTCSVFILGSSLLLWRYGMPPVVVRLFCAEPPVYGAQDNEEDKICVWLSRLPESIRDSVTSVTVLDAVNDSQAPPAGTCGDKPHDRGCVTIERASLDKETLWHESGHAYTLTLSDDFLYKWLEVPHAAYTYARWDYEDSADYPRRGILKRYGTKNAMEDIAVWVEVCYAALYDGKSDVLSHLPDDASFRTRFDLLHEYGFLNDADYQALLPYFTKS